MTHDRVFSVILSLSLIIYSTYCQTCSWDGMINLTPLSNSTIYCAFPGNAYEIIYSPCRADVLCGSSGGGGIGSKFMATQWSIAWEECAGMLYIVY